MSARAVLADGGGVDAREGDEQGSVDTELVRLAIHQVVRFWHSRGERYRRKWDLSNSRSVLFVQPCFG